MSFECPICGCKFYDRVVVTRPGNKSYSTEFFHCLGCAAMFLEPELFTAASALKENPPKMEKAHEIAAARQSLEWRFWEARAKRENGGIAATVEAINRLRGRYGR